MNDKEKLKFLYQKESKHSNYQILPQQLTAKLSNHMFNVKTRNEFERLNYIQNNVTVEGKIILDIGGNTGFFTFETIFLGAKQIYFYEGNESHTEFVSLAAKILNIENRIKIFNKYFLFEKKSSTQKYDVTLLLNVLHHLGDDYDQNISSREAAKQKIIDQINYLSGKTSILVFQLGFNWKGNRNCPLFDNGTKKEMIDFIRAGTKNFWSIEKIGVAEEINNSIKYSELNEKNINRNDKLGEFLNRPIFIMKSN